MAQEEKQLLLKDLCSRLPYDMIINVNDGKYRKDVKLHPHYIIALDAERWDAKPYLRPISCMTEEEVDTLFNVLKIDEKHGDWLKVNDIGIIRLFTEAGKDFYEIAAAFDYLNSIRVDYRGLIGKGLALEAPEGMYAFIG